jgi:hypothetical protein
LSSCSTQKATWSNIQFHNITTHYNIWWNGNESLKKGVAMMNAQYRDDYTRLLPVYKMGTKSESQSLNPQFDRAIEKSVKGIKKHSIFVDGQEHVPYIPKCYLMTAYANPNRSFGYCFVKAIGGGCEQVVNAVKQRDWKGCWIYLKHTASLLFQTPRILGVRKRVKQKSDVFIQ